MNRIIAPLLGPITYPVFMLAAGMYMWHAGELRSALIATLIGTAGTAWGWASR